jgi:hypothetical protein
MYNVEVRVSGAYDSDEYLIFTGAMIQHDIDNVMEKVKNGIIKVAERQQKRDEICRSTKFDFE